MQPAGLSLGFAVGPVVTVYAFLRCEGCGRGWRCAPFPCIRVVTLERDLVYGWFNLPCSAWLGAVSIQALLRWCGLLSLRGMLLSLALRMDRDI